VVQDRSSQRALRKPRLLSSIPRNEYFAALFIVGCFNGLGVQIIETLRSSGWGDAVFSTFGISAIVWIACYAGIRLILEQCSETLHTKDIIIGLPVLALFALPAGGLSWLAISILGLYVILFSVPSSALWRGAVILLATTVPMFWSHILFRYFGDLILSIDASLVGFLLRTGSHGNVIPFVDGSGSLIIMPYCSSFSNVWLAFLGWLLISQWQPRRLTFTDICRCFAAAASVISVNVTRIGLMGLSQWHFSVIHNQWGDTITNLLILCITFAICLLGMKHETDARI